jgi:hypothetical protein
MKEFNSLTVDYFRCNLVQVKQSRDKEAEKRREAESLAWSAEEKAAEVLPAENTILPSAPKPLYSTPQFR